MKPIGLVNCIVTIDAMGCQKEIARTIRESQADYILAVKGNQPTLATTITQFFDDMEKHEADGITFEHHETLDRKRGRLERRLYWLAPAPASLTASEEWKDLRTIGMVISERTIDDKTTRETRYYISSIANEVTEFSRAVRAH